MFETDRRNVNTESDSEVLLNVFAHELDRQRVLTPEAAFGGTFHVHETLTELEAAHARLHPLMVLLQHLRIDLELDPEGELLALLLGLDAPPA